MKLPKFVRHSFPKVYFIFRRETSHWYLSTGTSLTFLDLT